MASNKVTINDMEEFEIPDSRMGEIRDMLVRGNTTSEMLLYSKDVLDFMVHMIDKVRSRNHMKPVRDYVESVGATPSAAAMCTLEFVMPRRSGNTELALRLLEHHEDALLMVRDTETAKLLKDRVGNKSVADRITTSICQGELMERTGSLLITDLYDLFSDKDTVRKCINAKSTDPNFVWLKVGQ